MYYKKLKTRSFSKLLKKQTITEDDLIYYLQLIYSTSAFSTFPYLIDHKNSKQSLKYNCGNCVSLAMTIQKYLKKEKKVISYLIPATIPNSISFEGYLDISHVALAIPYSKTGVFIVDPAFYFLGPIDINLSNLPHKNSPILKSKIYSGKTTEIFSSSYKLSKKMVLNKYQTIAKNTVVCKCIEEDETWMYFLTEILNPDEAISTFFINIRKLPFITTTELDDDGVCKRRLDLRIKPDNQIDITFKNNNVYSGDITNIPTPTYVILDWEIGRFFEKDILSSLETKIAGPYFF
jgi:hypothetical protein